MRPFGLNVVRGIDDNYRLTSPSVTMKFELNSYTVTSASKETFSGNKSGVEQGQKYSNRRMLVGKRIGNA